MKNLITVSLLFNITIFELSLSSMQERIALRSYFLKKYTHVLVHQYGYVLQIIDAYKRERNLGDDVQVTIMDRNGQTLQPEDVYDKKFINGDKIVIVSRQWDIQLASAFLSKNKKISVKYMEGGDEITSLKRYIREEIEKERIFDSKFYTVTISLNGQALGDRDTIPVTGSLNPYRVELHKSSLDYKRDIKNNQMTIKLAGVPALKLYKYDHVPGYQDVEIRVPRKFITTEIVDIKVIQKLNKLQIEVDVDGKYQDGLSAFITPEDLPWKAFFYFLKDYEDWYSDDFTNVKTLQLYTFGKQMIGQWAAANDFDFKLE